MLKQTLGCVMAVTLGYGCASDVGPEGEALEVDGVGLAIVANDRYSQRVEGDFNGDGRGDVIIVTDSGSYEYLGVTTGGFIADAWVREDLKRGAVNYTVGDFNGDGKSDILITVSSGTYLYTGKGTATTGGFNPDIWTDESLTLGNVEFTVGDFSNDKRSDLIVTTDAGSYEIRGTGSGIFRAPEFIRDDLTKGNVQYTAGDFNGDGFGDLIITVGSGSFQYLGKSGGGFVADTWVRYDLGLGSVAYTTGDFNGDKRDDLIITVASGSYEYTGKGGTLGGFNADIWTRNDLSLGNVAFVSGDFSGDSRSDLIITVESGSYAYAAKADGTFNADRWTNTSLTLGNVDFIVSDFTGNGRADILAVDATGTREFGGNSSGGFNAALYTRNDLPRGSVSYF